MEGPAGITAGRVGCTCADVFGHNGRRLFGGQPAGILGGLLVLLQAQIAQTAEAATAEIATSTDEKSPQPQQHSAGTAGAASAVRVALRRHPRRTRRSAAGPASSDPMAPPALDVPPCWLSSAARVGWWRGTRRLPPLAAWRLALAGCAALRSAGTVVLELPGLLLR